MPFPYYTFEAQRPRNPAYPDELRTLGDHIRNKRLDLGLYQKDVARIIGVTTDTITYWEKGRAEPGIRYMPRIVDFLGYIPSEYPTALPEQLRLYRMLFGLTQEYAADEFNLDESTWRKWEGDLSKPQFDHSLAVISKVRACLAKTFGK